MEQTTVSQDLFDKIRSRFEGMQMANAEAKTTLDPTEAKFFTFEVTVDLHTPKCFARISHSPFLNHSGAPVGFPYLAQ